MPNRSNKHILNTMLGIPGSSLARKIAFKDIQKNGETIKLPNEPKIRAYAWCYQQTGYYTEYEN